MGIIGVWEESIRQRDPALVPPYMLEHERGQSFACTSSVGLVFAVRPSGSYVTGGKRTSGVFMALGRKSEGRGRYHTLRWMFIDQLRLSATPEQGPSLPDRWGDYIIVAFHFITGKSELHATHSHAKYSSSLTPCQSQWVGGLFVLPRRKSKNIL